MGMVVAIGLVVDDAIIVVESVERHIEEGMSPKDASLKAMEEVGGPVMASRSCSRRCFSRLFSYPESRGGFTNSLPSLSQYRCFCPPSMP